MMTDFGVSPVSQRVCSTGNTGQQTLSASPTKIIGSNPSRCGVKITNLSTIDVYLGFSQGIIAEGGGDLLIGIRGAWVYIETESEIWGYGANASVSYMEI